MEIGVVGLGKMGSQIAQKLSDSSFKVFGYPFFSRYFGEA